MAKYRKKSVIVEAKQWFKLGDVDGVNSYNEYLHIKPWTKIDPALKETIIQDALLCSCHQCGSSMANHGYITLEGGLMVCPADWIIKGESFPSKPDIFHQTYELFDEIDARLRAAAPDLLKAAKRARYLVVKNCPGLYVYEQLDPAIAKAEGDK